MTQLLRKPFLARELSEYDYASQACLTRARVVQIISFLTYPTESAAAQPIIAEISDGFHYLRACIAPVAMCHFQHAQCRSIVTLNGALIVLQRYRVSLHAERGGRVAACHARVEAFRWIGCDRAPVFGVPTYACLDPAVRAAIERAGEALRAPST